MNWLALFRQRVINLIFNRWMLIWIGHHMQGNVNIIRGFYWQP